MKKRPSYKQKKFASAYVRNHGNAYRAALEAGYSENTATNAGKNIVEKRGMQELLAEIGEVAWTPGSVRKDIELGKRRTFEKGDYTNFARFCEMEGRCEAMFIDRSKVESVGVLTIEQKNAVINRLKQLGIDISKPIKSNDLSVSQPSTSSATPSTLSANSTADKPSNDTGAIADERAEGGIGKKEENGG